MMMGLDQFLSTFGDITVSTVIGFVIAIVFAVKIYRCLKKYFIEKIKSDEEKDKKLEFAISEIKKYPEYREQSRNIQQELQGEIDQLKEEQRSMATAQENSIKILKEIQEDLKSREKSKLQDLLLRNYRYYTDKKNNPDGTWTEMESKAFWDLFKDYEDAGGNGFIHEVVQPAMNMLKVIDNE